MNYEDRNRMERDLALLEENEYYPHETAGVPNTEMVWRSQWEVEEYVYEQGYESATELWKLCTTDKFQEIGELVMMEGIEAAKHFIDDEIQETIDITLDEHLSTYLDGQMRMFAGYDVAENGDTLEEGDYGTWEDLRIAFEAGMYDKMNNDEKYSSI